ncbi:alpha-amylase [Hypnocyclicus thermotrophus]|uniref:Alpha-amylase n=1 Tax=Hypnocyclicus thermotrophus TaxID=1627895 RepID=A0AA46I5H6_9FUSO|nr:alpha-amylase [Hypnocyclicus thermotrophus]TDT69884.1 alpha-amylase [Hypnocyclicus thermotrophus]
MKKFLNFLFLLVFLTIIGCDKTSNLTSNLNNSSISASLVSEWNNAYFRGTPNSWNTSPMTKVASNTWEITVTFNNGDSSGGPRFKIDRYGDWSENYPSQDYYVSPNKTYKITFYDSTHEIKVTEINNSSSSINGTMMQYFEWYLPNDGSLWNKVASESSTLSNMGITALWLPPAYKGQAGSADVGYGVYDMYDLGEFNQKGTIRTKYGTKDEYLNAINVAHQNGIQIYGDVVFNHRMGADGKENVSATRVDWNNRNVTYETKTISAWTDFHFPGRNGKYSTFNWKWYHFDGVDWDDNSKQKAIFRFNGTGKSWDWEVDTENNNYDYLMGADLDMDHPEVVQELKDWGKWYLDFTGVDGFRLDAVKHIKFTFFNDWLDYLRSSTGKELFTVGEYWSYDINKLNNYITKSNGKMSLFDAPLHMNFHNASNGNGYYDMKNIFNGTLVQSNPLKAVTIVENHDTQPGQALESPVKDWFKPLAYAMILLRQDGYPCVFYGDMYGAQNIKSQYNTIKKLVEARKLYAYGEQRDYLDNPDIIGWTRLGDANHPKAMATILTDASGGSKWMYVGKANAKFIDYLGNRSDVIYSNNDGWAEFKVNGGSVSVWIEQ